MKATAGEAVGLLGLGGVLGCRACASSRVTWDSRGLAVVLIAAAIPLLVVFAILGLPYMHREAVLRARKHQERRATDQDSAPRE